ncbi:MAG: SUMF1/EgtB/PvdO family nonheme iron enzyme [Thermoguttaceae bacterium]
MQDLRSQTVILKSGRGQHRKYLPYAFTEQGVAMLSSVLRSSRAVEVNIQIMRAFVRLRQLLSVHEVTVDNFRQFVKDTRYKTEAEKDRKGGWGYNPKSGHCEGRKPRYNWRNPGFPQTDDHPVLNVTWNDAVAFCQWLSRKEGKTCRLPTEAEWEYACRAGTTTRYSNGDDPEGLAKVAKVTSDKGRTAFPAVQNLMVLQGEDDRFTAPVGSFPPNRFGLHDMHGNAWEWCADWYGEDYYSRSPVDDPPGPDSGTRRVRRGGGWNSFPLWPRSSFRNWNTPDSRCVNLGLRIARNE